MNDSALMFRSGGLLLLVVTAVGGALHLFDTQSDRTPSEPAAPRVQESLTSLPAQPASRPGSSAGASAEPCRVEQPVRPLPADVHESSGVAQSRRQAGVFWTHNDSGDPVVYAIGPDGALMGRTNLPGAKVQDWEDLAAAPCPGGDCLYVADIGDNKASRRSVTVYRFPEPAPGDRQSRPADAFSARYPDGPHDAEAMFVLPTGQIYIVTKGETGPITLYRFPPGAQPGQTVELERVREVASGESPRGERITGAAASRDGRWIAVRTLRSLSIYSARDFLGSGEHRARQMDLSSLNEPQGEAIGFGAGNSLVLTSEGGKKDVSATFARLVCDLR